MRCQALCHHCGDNHTKGQVQELTTFSWKIGNNNNNNNMHHLLRSYYVPGPRWILKEHFVSP